MSANFDPELFTVEYFRYREDRPCPAKAPYLLLEGTMENEAALKEAIERVPGLRVSIRPEISYTLKETMILAPGDRMLCNARRQQEKIDRSSSRTPARTQEEAEPSSRMPLSPHPPTPPQQQQQHQQPAPLATPTPTPTPPRPATPEQVTLPFVRLRLQWVGRAPVAHNIILPDPDHTHKGYLDFDSSSSISQWSSAISDRPRPGYEPVSIAKFTLERAYYRETGAKLSDLLPPDEGEGSGEEVEWSLMLGW
ncbi:hypothetical protein B0T26DRAFT_675681 [Lasiosphaeria miniovina]|uniref:Uncharacterized protein n=1 Tax=Lasiosphaeria miniovina TaxID=1954250 RepID=A0AA40AKA4_9PEZI|nr:uncharacterized protein B0T26DRAFT_675681 [Lasiosphaeria miniovina]KAK0717359.1 hypothetical protein B0T26DRAFT_675681 [Lasiosphaeria miniovina]